MKNSLLSLLRTPVSLVVPGLAAVFLSVVLVPAANAQTASVEALSQRQFANGNNEALVSLSDSFSSFTLTDGDLYAGAQTVTSVTGGNGLLPATPFSAYCVDLVSPIVRDDITTVGPLDSSFNLGYAATHPGVNTGGAIAWLYNNYAPAISGTTNLAAQNSAALQLSMWEVEYNWTGVGTAGVDPTLATGNFQYLGNNVGTSDQIRLDAAGMLTAWAGQTSTAQVLEGTPGSNQALVVPPPPPPTAVPEPSALLLAFGPILGLAGSARLRRRQG